MYEYVLGVLTLVAGPQEPIDPDLEHLFYTEITPNLLNPKSADKEEESFNDKRVRRTARRLIRRQIQNELGWGDE